MTTAAEQMAGDWIRIESAPKDGSLLDARFDIASAEDDMAEFYAPSCTSKVDPTQPVIANVTFCNGHFRPVIDADGAREVASLAGGWGTATGVAYGIVSVTLTHWRPAANPFN